MKRSRPVLPWLLGGCILILVAGLGWMMWLTWQDHVATTSFLKAASSAGSAAREGTDERPVSTSEKQSYVVAPDLPRYLTIPKIGVYARVLRLGLNDDGEIAAPQGIWDTGWYEGSAKPGENGTSFIDGHISGPTLPAVFVRLHELQSGDEIDIERGRGEMLHYKVQTVTSVKKDAIDMQTLLGPHGDNQQSLVLMTCIGQFNPAQYRYDSRLEVVAVRV